SIAPAATPVWTGLAPEYRNDVASENRVATVLSSCVHAWWTIPWTGSQVSIVHGSPSSMERGPLPTQIPAWQGSTSTHALPSTHEVPWGLGGFEHWPVAASHLPA